MRLRTKLFLTSSVVVLLLWASMLWPIQRLIGSNFDHVANANFAHARKGLLTLQAQRVGQMRQVGRMLMEIPELRALIAEHNFEVSEDNLNSLRERLDNLSQVMEVPFVCVCDARGAVIAQNGQSPWKSLDDLRQYLPNSAQAKPLIERLYPSGDAKANLSGEFGLWLYHGQIFQVVGLPLVFDADQDTSHVDGALIMASPITSALADKLAGSNGCEISFLTSDGSIVSSLNSDAAHEVGVAYVNSHWPTRSNFDIQIAGQPYRSYIEPLIDPCSQTPVGATLIQSSMADGIALQRQIFTSLLAIMSGGLLIAGIVSFVLSGAVTRPVRELVRVVKRVAEGDMNAVIVTNQHDEIGELGAAFNDMMAQLKARRELERLVQESQAASKAKSQFLANMSHEIRTPLHGVIGMANLLLGTDLNEQQRHYAHLVRSSTEVLTTLINDILDFSKIEAGKLELEAVEFDLHGVVEDVVELLYQKAIAKGVEVACEIDASVPRRIIGDSTRLRQMLLNLVGNSVKFTDKGEIVVRVARDASVSDSVRLRFDITDTGIGIPADRIGRLFQSFNQVDASTTRRFGGTGLGLAISKQLAELMGGQIGVESELGKGSRFWFTINMKECGSTQEATRANSALNGLRVLVAEPNASLRGILSRQLAIAGIDSLAVGSGDEVRRAMGDSKGMSFRVILVSQNLGGLAHVSSLARERKIPAVLLGSGAGLEKPEALREAGFDFALAKPVRREAMLALLARAIGAGEEKATPSTSDASTKRWNRTVRVLVAEDNEINQIVAAEFLRKVGFDSVIVNDGQLAVQAFLDGQYDLVLMDCQMPVMDGFEATGVIRRHEQSMKSSANGARHVPIIALTANASGADRGRCMEAGMDAYCGKPFNEQELLDTFARFLPEVAPQASTPDATTDAVGSAPIDNPPFTVSALRERCTGNATLALSILDKFEAQLNEASARIENSLREGNATEVARVAHSLKGTAGVLSAEALRAGLAELEQFGRKQELERAQTCFANLRQEIERCADYASQARSELKTATA
jgi:signal transduction histidine kinase/CheY-like chemotaxis protein